MTPIKHPLCNADLGRPTGWKESECSSLPVTVDATNKTLTSYWQPSHAERDLIAAGSSISLTVHGAHPPVRLEVAAKLHQRPEDGADVRIRHAAFDIGCIIEAHEFTHEEVVALFGFLISALREHIGTSLVNVFSMLSSAARAFSAPPNPSRK